MSRYLRAHNFPEDLRNMNYDELELLSYEMRDFLVDSISRTGGHLASNLGIVEITIALHKSLNTPEDKIVWDVGHQTYVHKVLTGRIEGFNKLRQLDGMSGFPKVCESEYDLFDTGHSSSSISLGLGLAAARDLQGKDYKVVSVIGDGALTGGLAYEALNNAGNMNTNFIVILNDNGMSISRNTGGLSRSLGRITSTDTYIHMKTQLKKGFKKVPVIGESVISGIHNAKENIKYAVIDGILFEELGFKYIGPVDGHNIKEMCETLNHAKAINGPVLIHAVTNKGKGYSKAEENPDVFHGIGPFDIDTGKPLKKPIGRSYSDVFGNKLTEMADKDESIVAISAAMVDGVGLEGFRSIFPDRFFDVGIAEEHAVTFSAGLAKAGLRPYIAIYSSFLQRAYDEIIEDVCLQNLPVTICIDRAGVVGADGETHHGLFDLAYLKSMPNMTVFAPKDGAELERMLELTLELDGPCAIRYPRGSAHKIGKNQQITKGKAYQLNRGTDAEIWAVGNMVKNAMEAAAILKKDGFSAGVVNVATVNPLDKKKLMNSASVLPMIVTVEDGVLSGGIGESIRSFLANTNTNVFNLGWPDKFIEHGTQEQLYARYGLDAESIAEFIKSNIKVDSKKK
ncbi:MAG: 1-deoxy-D-xylulose-5-phosphate synthase [Eubacteriales bacterium]|nr:1-deoxy-D-xylulose-5-phosphate synthase [Eubacteriales bacterium]